MIVIDYILNFGGCYAIFLMTGKAQIYRPHRNSAKRCCYISRQCPACDRNGKLTLKHDSPKDSSNAGTYTDKRRISTLFV